MTILLVRAVLLAATCAFLAAAVLAHDHPLAMALGLAPLAWLALEALWRLTDPGRLAPPEEGRGAEPKIGTIVPISGERLDPD